MKKVPLTSNRFVGKDEFPFIVAEIGINHNGDLELAKKMIRSAKEIGIDAVKFQVKDIEEAHPKELLDMLYTGPNSYGNTYREHKQALEFSQEELEEIYDYAKELDIICFSTPCNVNAVQRLEKLNNPIYKIASIFVTNLDLIEEICKTGKPVIMSTGCSTVEEIDKAVNLIRSYHENLVLLHSTTSYPTNDEDINFNVIPTLENHYDCPIGYSGHEKGLGVTVSCIALGACVIERHFTLDRTMKGPDHASSIEREGMRLLVSRAKRLHIALGLPDIRMLDCELPVRKKFRGY